MLKIQEDMDVCLDQRDEELRQLQSQSQVDGAQHAALSLQVLELISLVESRAEVGKDLEEINGQFHCHRGEINRLKIREKDAKEKTEKSKGFIVGAGHEAQVFKNRLDRMEESCQEIGLVAIMFFFELLFSYVSLAISSMFLLLTYSQSFLSLSADYLRHSRRRRSKIDSTSTGNSLNIILQLKNL